MSRKYIHLRINSSGSTTKVHSVMCDFRFLRSLYGKVDWQKSGVHPPPPYTLMDTRTSEDAENILHNRWRECSILHLIIYYNCFEKIVAFMTHVRRDTFFWTDQVYHMCVAQRLSHLFTIYIDRWTHYINHTAECIALPYRRILSTLDICTTNV